MDATMTTHLLQKLDAIRESQIRGETALTEVVELLKQQLLAVRVAAPVPSQTGFLSRLERLLPLLKPIGAIAIKQAVTVLMIWYLVKGGDAYQAAEMLLKLL
jgi:hypothetical protein